MALKYAPVCTQCGTTRTRHSSGLCSRCRHRSVPRRACRLCGDRATKHESGLCYRCRQRGSEQDRLAEAIARHKEILSILELRARGLSFSGIAEATGRSRSMAYGIYRGALSMPARNIYAEEG